MLQILGILSGIIGAIAVVPYIIDIFKGTTRPQRATWLIWTVLGGIAFFSQLAKGATDSLWMTGIQTLAVIVVFLLSIKYGEGGLSSRDIKALIIAGIGLILWFFTKEATFALYFVILVDGAGALLTIIKAHEDPSGETMSTWFISGLSGLMAAFSVGSWDLILLSYPIYIWLINWAVVVAMKTSPKKI